MFVNHTESTKFIRALKKAGVTIQNEREVIERLQESREWHYAFSTLVRQGRPLGIWFAPGRTLRPCLVRLIFAKFKFTRADESEFEAALSV